MPRLRESAGSSHAHWLAAASGICTTDTFPKLASRTFTLPSTPGVTYSLAGITKGAGMVHPNMATTLGIVCTDAPVAPRALQRLLTTTAETSYNRISIDGDTSTNDMVVLLANGAAAPRDGGDIARVDIEERGGGGGADRPQQPSPSADFAALQRALSRFMASLAQLVVRDGEGASRFATIRVRGAPSADAARRIASVLARSVLVKTGLGAGAASRGSVQGKETAAAAAAAPATSVPNWATVQAALGYALLDTPFEGKGVIVPELTSVSFGPGRGHVDVDGVVSNGDGNGALVKFLDRGAPAQVEANVARRIMESEDVEIVVDLRDDGRGAKGSGEGGEAEYWTCDLTHDFITMNAGE